MTKIEMKRRFSAEKQNCLLTEEKIGFAEGQR